MWVKHLQNALGRNLLPEFFVLATNSLGMLSDGHRELGKAFGVFAQFHRHADVGVAHSVISFKALDENLIRSRLTRFLTEFRYSWIFDFNFVEERNGVVQGLGVVKGTLFIKMRYEHFHGSLRGFQFGSFLAAAGSGSVLYVFQHHRAGVGFRRVLQLRVRVFRRDLQHVLHIFVEYADRRLPYRIQLKLPPQLGLSQCRGVSWEFVGDEF